VPPDAAAGAVSDVNQLGNQRLKIPAQKGQVLLQTMLGTSTVDTARFPAGGAASVTISDPNRVPADLRAGDTVDVFELTKDKANRFLTNIKVRTVGLQAETGGDAATAPAQNGAIPATIVGLNVGSGDAQDLYNVVARGGQIALYLHNPSTP
jgi:hypothetical protein